MHQQELEIVHKLIDFTEKGILSWQPTDIRGTYYTEYAGLPYIVGMDAILLDDSHQCLAYYVSAKFETWERVAFAQEDDLTYELEKEDQEISRLFNLASAQSTGNEVKIINELAATGDYKLDTNKKPKIFISHSSNDELFVRALYQLLEEHGFTSDDIFCSSVYGSGIGVGRKIFDTLIEQFYQYELCVLFIHSPRFYKSPISLNEMGAAWALRTHYFSILTKDMTVKKMEAVVDNNEIAVKVNDKMAVERTIELMKQLQDFFKKKHIPEQESRKFCEEYIQYVNDLCYTPWWKEFEGKILKEFFIQILSSALRI